MSKLTTNQKSVADKVEAGKMYTLKEAAELVKEITTTKFDASLDVDVRLGVDPRKANQMVRGVVSLPNGTGKVTRVLALCCLLYTSPSPRDVRSYLVCRLRPLPERHRLR